MLVTVIQTIVHTEFYTTVKLIIIDSNRYCCCLYVSKYLITMITFGVIMDDQILINLNIIYVIAIMVVFYYLAVINIFDILI